MAKKRYNKVEEEILQILESAERQGPARRRLPRGRFRRPSFPRPRIAGSGTSWLGASFALALLAILVAGWSSTLAVLIAILSLVAFFTPVVQSFRGPSQPSPSRRWRGRDIDLPPQRSTIIGEIRYQIWRLRNRR